MTSQLDMWLAGSI